MSARAAIRAAMRALRTAHPVLAVCAAADVMRAAHHGVPEMPHASHIGQVPHPHRHLVGCACAGCGAAWDVAHRLAALRRAPRVDRRERNAAYAALGARYMAALRRTWVSVSDSVAAGHCARGTAQAELAIRSALGAEGELGAIRGDELLRLRGQADPFARRAIAAAAARQGVAL